MVTLPCSCEHQEMAVRPCGFRPGRTLAGCTLTTASWLTLIAMHQPLTDIGPARTDTMHAPGQHAAGVLVKPHVDRLSTACAAAALPRMLGAMQLVT
jgi:hypothetical protein